MIKNLILKTHGVKVVITALIIILSVTLAVTGKNLLWLPMNEPLGETSAEPIWIYDSELYIKHVETADLNGDYVKDVIAAEYDNNYYTEDSSVYAIDGTDGSTIWTYGLNDGIRSMTIGDINNDCVMDVIAGAGKGSPDPDGRVHAIDGTDGSVIWIFVPGGSGDTNGDVAIGDFNNDDYLDVAVACWDDYVYAIDGETGDQLWSQFIGSIFVTAVDTGDVNGDGIDDVAFSNSYLAGWDNNQGVLDGSDGSIIWNQTVLFTVENVLMADIDDDSVLEAVFGVNTDDDELEIHVRNATNGALEWKYTIGSSTTSADAFLFTNDIDEDGDIDLIVGSEYVNNYIYAFDGSSNTTMWISEELNGYARDLAFGDVTGDGNKNIVAATYDRVQVLEANNGTLNWYYSVSGTIASVACADFDSDGILDVAAGGSADASGVPPNPEKSVWALRTVQSPLLWEFEFGEYGNAISIGDLNGDEFMDVVAVCSLDDTAFAIDGEDGSELWTWVGTENLYAITSGNFDDYGQDDIAVAGADDRISAIYGNNGSLMWQFDTGNQIYRKCLQSADLNDDGCIDVIAGCDDSNVYAINGENGNQIWSCFVGAGVNEIELSQMDGYGPLDIVVAVGSGTNGKKVVVINGSDGSIEWTYNAPEAVEHVEVMDVNNDTVPDVAAAITPFNPIQLVMINGLTHSSIWTKSIPIASNVHSLAHGDLNGDNIPDIVVPGSSSDKKVYALDGEDGDELWSYQTGGEINTLAVVDINLDYDLDVIAGSDDQNVYALYGENGSSFWDFSTADDVMHIQIGDISGDGKPNIACVTFGSDGVVYAFKSFSEPINYPPYIPSNPYPEDDAMYVDPNDDLSWSGGDPNPGDIVTYDVYFGTSSPPLKIESNQSETTYNPGTMSYNTIYYWKIVAWDDENLSAEGPEWSFTVEGPNNPPNEPSDPLPEDDETNVDVETDLSWTGGDPDPGDTVTYDVYFGTNSPPPKVADDLLETEYEPGTMEFVTTYYWKIIAQDNHGYTTSGSEWSFITRENNPPNSPGDPEPEDGATDVDINSDLGWTCSDPDGDDITYDVYFEVEDPTPDELVSSNQSEDWYDPGTMDYDTHYYWQIVAWDEYGESTTGSIWDFTTGSTPNDPPYEPSDPEPENGATNVDIDADLYWTGGDPNGDTVTYDVYLEANDPTPDVKVADDISEMTFDPGIMTYDTTYYWQINAKDEHGASMWGAVWEFTTEASPKPDLSCEGNLAWSKIKPGTEVIGNFTVTNIGEPDSNLDWEISDWPSWGTWTITPLEGSDLKPEDSSFTIEVSVVAPNEKNKDYNGNVTIVNKEDGSDTCSIQVTLSTPMNKKISIRQILYQFLQYLAQRFPMFNQILSFFFYKFLKFN